MKHTPGNWKVEKVESEKSLVYCRINSDNGTIGFAGTYLVKKRLTKEEALANAKLIAAAPEMLEALQSVNNYFIDLQNKCALTNSDERAWKLTAKAIKRATE